MIVEYQEDLPCFNGLPIPEHLHIRLHKVHEVLLVRRLLQLEGMVRVDLVLKSTQDGDSTGSVLVESVLEHHILGLPGAESFVPKMCAGLVHEDAQPSLFHPPG